MCAVCVLYNACYTASLYSFKQLSWIALLITGTRVGGFLPCTCRAASGCCGVDTICELSPGTHRYVTVGRLACFNFHCCFFVRCGVDTVCELSPGSHRYVTVQIGLCVFVCVCMCVHVCVRVCVCVL